MSASISTTSETLVVSIETDGGKLQSQAAIAGYQMSKRVLFAVPHYFIPTQLPTVCSTYCEPTCFEHRSSLRIETDDKPPCNKLKRGFVPTINRVAPRKGTSLVLQNTVQPREHAEQIALVPRLFPE